MYAALFEMDSMFLRKAKFIFSGPTPEAVMAEFEDVQDLECLVMNGRYEEGAQGQAELDRLEEIYNKYMDGTITMADIRDLNAKLSIGYIKCLAVAEGEEAVAEMKAQNPKAMQR